MTRRNITASRRRWWFKSRARNLLSVGLGRQVYEVTEFVMLVSSSAQVGAVCGDEVG